MDWNRRTYHRAIGRITRNIVAMNAAVNASVGTTAPVSDRATAVMKASRHHAVTSSTAAQARAIDPSSLFCIPRSVRIRARTGNAVIDIEIPMKSANTRNGTSGDENRG